MPPSVTRFNLLRKVKGKSNLAYISFLLKPTDVSFNSTSAWLLLVVIAHVCDFIIYIN